MCITFGPFHHAQKADGVTSGDVLRQIERNNCFFFLGQVVRVRHPSPATCAGIRQSPVHHRRLVDVVVAQKLFHLAVAMVRQQNPVLRLTEEPATAIVRKFVDDAIKPN